MSILRLFSATQQTRQTTRTDLSLIKVVQSFLETVCIAFCVYRSRSPLLIKVCTSGREWSTSNDGLNVILHIERFVLTGITTQGQPCPSIKEELFKVGFYSSNASRRSAVLLQPSPEWMSSSSKVEHFVGKHCRGVDPVAILRRKFQPNKLRSIRLIVALVRRRQDDSKFARATISVKE
jgi:hypothetical protein